MQRLSQRDLEALLSYLQRIYAYSASGLEAFASGTVSTLPKLVPSDSVSYNEIDASSGEMLSLVTDPPASEYDPQAARVFAHYIHEHPRLNHYRHTRDGQAMKVSDFLSTSQWHRLGLYNEFYKELRDVEHQMAILLPAPAPRLIVLALDRSGREDFSEGDRILFNMLRPHLAQAYQNAEAATRAQRESGQLKWALEGSERGVIALCTRNRVRWSTQQARRWVSEYFEPPLRADRLPESLRSWVEHQRWLLVGANRSIPPPHKSLIVKRAGKRLKVRLVADDSQEDSLMWLLGSLIRSRRSWFMRPKARPTSR
jgi:GAF domain-containing protein